MYYNILQNYRQRHRLTFTNTYNAYSHSDIGNTISGIIYLFVYTSNEMIILKTRFFPRSKNIYFYTYTKVYRGLVNPLCIYIYILCVYFHIVTNNVTGAYGGSFNTRSCLTRDRRYAITITTMFLRNGEPRR